MSLSEKQLERRRQIDKYWEKRGLKAPLYFPRCLNCDHILWLRDRLGRRRKTVVCQGCMLAYSYTFIKGADPYTWERTRDRKLFKLRKLTDGRVIIEHRGLGGRRIVD